MVQKNNERQFPATSLVRGRISHKIRQIKSISDKFNWGCVCHAITTMDLFEERQGKKLRNVCQSQTEEWTFALACMFMSFKYLSGKGLKLLELIQRMDFEEENDVIKENVLEMQELILQGIDFQFPTLNGYDYLESLITNDQFQCKDSRNKAVFSLSILLTAYSICSFVSHNPMIAQDIHEITKTKRKKRSIIGKLYKKCWTLIQQSSQA